MKAWTQPSGRKRNPVLTVLLSIVVFFVLDGIVFRSGWYQNHLLSYQNPPGQLAQEIHFERKRRTLNNDVLLMGDSTLENGFSEKVFDERYPHASVHIVKLTVPTTNARSWYYTLRHIDPSHDRYRMIVLPVHDYKVIADYENTAGEFQTAADLVGIVSLREWLDMVRHIASPDMRDRVTMIGLFPSHAWGPDLQDFLLHPFRRMENFDTYYKYHEQWQHDIRSMPTSLAGIKVDPQAHKVMFFPEDINNFVRVSIDGALYPVPPADAVVNTARNAAFLKEWLGRIVNMYKGSPTQILFVQVPRWPLPFPAKAALPDAPDVRDLLPQQPNVQFVDPTAFEFLEKPQYFSDCCHLNEEGQTLFTIASGQEIQRAATGPLKAGP